MKREIRNKIVIAWLLCILALPSLVKFIHTHDCQVLCEHAGDGHHHDCNTCAICQYAISVFTEAGSSEITSVPVITLAEAFTYQKGEYLTGLFTCYLRGPPRA